MGYKKLSLLIIIIHGHIFGMHINDLLFKAVKNGKINDVRWWLNHRASVNSYILGNKNPIKMNKTMANKFALFEKPYISHWTPLHVAVVNGYLTIAHLLLTHGACVNAKSGPMFIFSDKNYTPMEMATITGNLSMVKLLMQYNPEDDYGTLTYFAAQYKHFKLFKFFVDYQDNPLFNINAADSLLLYMLEHDQTPMIRYLVENKIDGNFQLKKQFTELCSSHNFLYLSAMYENNFLLEYLLKIGLNPNQPITNSFGSSTPLHKVAEQGNIDLAQMLIDYGADVNIGSWSTESFLFKDTPLHCAVNGEHIEMIKFLLQHGADVDALNRNKKTPIYCGRNNPHAKYWLLLYGAKIDDQLVRHAPFNVSYHYTNPFDTTSFDMTRIFNSWKTNKQDFYSYGLFVAAHFNDYQLLQKLFEHGADANVINQKGHTPLIVAIKNNNFACAYRLLIGTIVKKDKFNKLPIDYAKTVAMQNMINWYTSNRSKFCHLGLILAGKCGDGDLIKYSVGHGYLKQMNNPEQIKNSKKRKWARDHGPSKRLKRLSLSF